MATPPRVTLLTIPGLCPLCDEARELLEHSQITFEEIDIRSDRGLLRAHRLEIPVTVVDGRKRFIGRIDLTKLRKLLD
ncbi:MAG: glutaredoxin family protein [Planctomycetota bacterium]